MVAEFRRPDTSHLFLRVQFGALGAPELTGRLRRLTMAASNNERSPKLRTKLSICPGASLRARPIGSQFAAGQLVSSR